MHSCMRKRTISALLVAVAGCADSTDIAKTATTDQEVEINNGSSLNGSSLNGSSLNGSSLNGSSLNGSSLNGSSLNGATYTGTLSNGMTIELQINDAATLDGANSDVWTYVVTYNADDGWHPLCGYEDDGSARRALAVPGVWDTTTGAWFDDGTQFTFACRKASIAKCVELGYKSWLGYGDHQHACVRMLRADYCGDGYSHTVNGTLINLYDDVGVQADTYDWQIDAEWTPDGALCFNHYRGSTEMPACPEKYQPATCGTFGTGALLIDEYE